MFYSLNFKHNGESVVIEYFDKLTDAKNYQKEFDQSVAIVGRSEIVEEHEKDFGQRYAAGWDKVLLFLQN